VDVDAIFGSFTSSKAEALARNVQGQRNKNSSVYQADMNKYTIKRGNIHFLSPDKHKTSFVYDVQNIRVIRGYQFLKNVQMNAKRKKNEQK